eukprot:NODE_624_length_1256_cov_943.043082_g451_i0.p1 GENE.NODE_624_length_1256_cov_943.043082_g451_i0~~NODE_624_length_1256_cov_943.043082_g451_i0.p1  ORF type:complete len:154 (+),score=62.74 NODE_624_length_1256_cov_943.043082_g451_i0:62-463(+)
MKIEVTATAANIKKIDPEAYGITRRDGWLKLKIGDTEHKTTEIKGCFDPIWDETFTFEVTDPVNQQLEVSFYMGEVQVGTTGTYNLDGLKKGVGTYKGLAVPGGKADISLRPLDFGKEEEEKEEEAEDWMSFV